MVVVEVPFTDLVSLVGDLIELHHEGQVGQAPGLHLRGLHCVPEDRGLGSIHWIHVKALLYYALFHSRF